MDIGEDQYESLGSNASMAQNAIAGAFAGIGEHCLMYPIDAYKTRVQVLHKATAVTLRNTWRGVYSVVMGAGPAHALHFATFEYCRARFATSTHDLVASGAAGACATFAHDALMTPFDVVKQRMQLASYRSVRECARKIYAAEGWAAFYISLPTTLSMSVPFQSLQFAMYDYASSLLNPSNTYDPKSHMMAGALAGAVASSITTPLDVIKTLLQTRGNATDPRIRHCSGFWEGAKLIAERHGATGFFRGFKPRVLTHMPSTAISWSVYEYFKWFLSTYQPAATATTATTTAVSSST
ncbi:mitochondrial carrier domain-containing protein [Zychaea mexicana]|uniref:mitochondrial carrier domain-containing protein n=1 Tax=Zychaea mexicana TaxID=64656 RepID=UPI0022FF0BF5|nr:mitochondrial carrier domain-containing protein [Zychaea mexicana]KAI9494672.1 mitochondrial carrier domain-containing protein [Zychaea mexicana]